jgi:hypothetical protein
MYKFLNPLWIINNWLTTYWIGAAISVAGSLYGASKAGDAADAQVDSAQQGIDEIKKIGERTRSDTQPYRDLGTASTSKLSYLLGLTDKTAQGQYDKKYGQLVDTSGPVPKAIESLYASDPAYRKAWDLVQENHNKQYKGGYTADSSAAGIEAGLRSVLPTADSFGELDTSDGQYGSLMKKFNQDDLDSDLVYQNGLQFGLDQGQKTIENRARALGGLDSGAATKAAIRYANDYGTTKTEGAYNRNASEKSNIFNMLMGGTGTGLSAVNTDASTGQNIATALAGQYASQGNARAAGSAAEGKAGGAIAEAIGGFF